MTDTATRASPLDLPCPFCGAAIGSPCRTMSAPSSRTDPHTRRRPVDPNRPERKVRDPGTIPRAAFRPGAMYYRVVATNRTRAGGVWLAVQWTLGGTTVLVGVELSPDDCPAEGWSERALREALTSGRFVLPRSSFGLLAGSFGNRLPDAPDGSTILNT